MIYRIAEEPTPRSESPLPEAVRFLPRQAVNIASTAVGLPGNLAALANDLIAGPLYSAISGKPAVPYEQTPIGKILPTIEQHKSALQKLSPELLSPQSQSEKFLDQVIEDAVTLGVPAARASKTASTMSKVIRPLAISTGANIAGSLTEGLTADERVGAAAKLGSLFALSLISKNSAAKHVGDLYKRAEQAIPENASVDASRLRGSLGELRDKVSRGTLAPSEKFVYDEANEVLNKIHNGRISPLEAWASKRSLNEKLQNLVYSSADKTANARAKKLASSIQKGLDGVLETYGKKNPAFYDAYKPAQAAFGTIAQSNFVSNLASKYLPGNVQKVVGPAFGIGPIPGLAASSALGILGLPGGGSLGLGEMGYYGAKYLYRIGKDKTLARYYTAALKSAADQNVAGFISNSEKLAKGLESKDEKIRYTLVD